MNEMLMDNEFDFQAFYAMILNTTFFTMFYGNAIPLLYLLSIAAFSSLYISSFIVFRHFSLKPVMFDHSLNSAVSKILCMALVIHQLTSILFLYTDDIFPLGIELDSRPSRLFVRVQHGAHFLVLMMVLLVFTFNYNFICRIAKKYYDVLVSQHCTAPKQPRLFSQVFGGDTPLEGNEGIGVKDTGETVSDYLSSYRMEDNPKYLNICYALKILSVLEPYFTSCGAELRRSCRYSSKEVMAIEVKHQNLVHEIVCEESEDEDSEEEKGNLSVAMGSERKIEMEENKETNRRLGEQ
jgi:hypothetical protein